MDPKEELKELVGQVKEHLRLQMELGLDFLQASPPPAATGAAQAGPKAEAEPELSLLSPQSPYPWLTPGRQTTLEEVRQILGDCTRCKLHKGRKTIVFGSGNPRAALVFVGEGPGADEDEQGLPFVGRAGQLLTRMIEAMGLTRDKVYICNIIKCFISPRVLIYTAEGYKPIKDIREGDLVLTHNGRFRKVTYIRPRETLPQGSEVVRLTVRSEGGGNRRPLNVTVTPEHPFFVNGEWKRAADIHVGDRILALGDRCEVCGQVFYVRYDRYERRVARTCGRYCHNRRILHNKASRDRSQQTMLQQYAEGLRDPVKTPSGEYVFINVTVTKVEHRRTGRNFPLYNIGVEEDESYVVAGLLSHNCRPPGNRNPEPDEIASCEPFLIGQLSAIRPKLICALGTFAAQTLLQTKEPISKLRGRFFSYQGIPLLPTFHPAYLLRNPHEKKTAWEDLKLLKREYERLAKG